MAPAGSRPATQQRAAPDVSCAEPLENRRSWTGIWRKIAHQPADVQREPFDDAPEARSISGALWRLDRSERQRIMRSSIAFGWCVVDVVIGCPTWAEPEWSPSPGCRDSAWRHVRLDRRSVIGNAGSSARRTASLCRCVGHPARGRIWVRRPVRANGPSWCCQEAGGCRAAFVPVTHGLFGAMCSRIAVASCPSCLVCWGVSVSKIARRTDSTWLGAALASCW